MGKPTDQPEISYPCLWEYTVIGADEQRLRDAVAAAVPHCDYTLAPSRTSRTGKYCSLRLELTVVDEDQRNSIFARLAGHDDVTMVL